MNEQKFRIFRVKEIEFGAFCCTKFVFNLDAEGAQILVNLFCCFQGVFLFLAFFLDVAGIVIVFCFKGLFLLFKAILQLLKQAFEKMFESLFGFCLKTLFVLILIFLTISKWQNIKEILANFHFFD